MIVWISTGLIIMNEAKNYETMNLWGIFFGIAMCAVGIKILMMKSHAT